VRLKRKCRTLQVRLICPSPNGEFRFSHFQPLIRYVQHKCHRISQKRCSCVPHQSHTLKNRDEISPQATLDPRSPRHQTFAFVHHHNCRCMSHTKPATCSISPFSSNIRASPHPDAQSHPGDTAHVVLINEKRTRSCSPFTLLSTCTLETRLRPNITSITALGKHAHASTDAHWPNQLPCALRRSTHRVRSSLSAAARRVQTNLNHIHTQKKQYSKPHSHIN
jgi:hypothetical protein